MNTPSMLLLVGTWGSDWLRWTVGWIALVPDSASEVNPPLQFAIRHIGSGVNKCWFSFRQNWLPGTSDSWQTFVLDKQQNVKLNALARSLHLIETEIPFHAVVERLFHLSKFFVVYKRDRRAVLRNQILFERELFPDNQNNQEQELFDSSGENYEFQ